jgi:hypothetical protein
MGKHDRGRRGAGASCTTVNVIEERQAGFGSPPCGHLGAIRDPQALGVATFADADLRQAAAW